MARRHPETPGLGKDQGTARLMRIRRPSMWWFVSVSVLMRAIGPSAGGVNGGSGGGVSAWCG